MLLYKVDNLLAEMVDVDHGFGASSLNEGVECVLQQGLAQYGHQCLGHGVSEGLEAWAQTSGKDQGVHGVESWGGGISGWLLFYCRLSRL